MKIAAILLLLAGWIIVLAAVALFKPAAISARTLFIIAGLCIEALGLFYIVRSHLPHARGDNA